MALEILDCFYQFDGQDGEIDAYLHQKIQHLRQLVKANPGLACQVKQYIFEHFADRINQLCDQYEPLE
ncbi:hypothetical protein [Parageobacillus galactosidasius]|uniref:hypothetical protein n=1 Tax=Parageobacillus galactosidasius TaxID=883812 RepID=UPI001130CE5B|nr:hypothetical protein [Parageobacillus galactosidasius]